MTLFNISRVKQLPKLNTDYIYNASLKSYNSLGLDVKAKILFIPENEEELSCFLRDISKKSTKTSSTISSSTTKEDDLRIIVIGAGSNILFSHEYINAMIIVLGKGFNYVKNVEKKLIIGAKTPDKLIAITAMNLSLSGCEFLSTIPGNIGGGVIMNTGAYGSEISDILDNIKVIDFDGTKKTIANKDITFSYRNSKIKSIVSEVTLNLKKCHRETVIAKIKLLKEQRISSQPQGVRTMGSTFKNPKGHSAWQLLDKANMREYRVGDACFSKKHPNFIINLGGAKPADVIKLINIAKERVWNISAIMLEEEVKII